MAQYLEYSNNQFREVVNPVTGTRCRTGQLNHQFVEQVYTGGAWVDIGEADTPRYSDVAGEGCKFREGCRDGNYVVDVELEIAGFLLGEGVGWDNLGVSSGYWAAENIVLTQTVYGLRLSWTASTFPLDIWLSINSAAYFLLATMPIGASYYDYYTDSTIDLSFKIRAVSDDAAPAVSTATVEDYDKTAVIVSFDKDIDSTSIPATSAFALSGKTISSVTYYSPRTIKLVVSVAYGYGDSISLNYTQPVSNPLKSIWGVKVDSFASQTVTNNIAFAI